MIFHPSTGLPMQSSPAPLKKKNSDCFAYDGSLTSPRAIKSSISCQSLQHQNKQSEQEAEMSDSRCYSTSAPASTNCLLGNFEVRGITSMYYCNEYSIRKRNFHVSHECQRNYLLIACRSCAGEHSQRQNRASGSGGWLCCRDRSKRLVLSAACHLACHCLFLQSVRGQCSLTLPG